MTAGSWESPNVKTEVRTTGVPLNQRNPGTDGYRSPTDATQTIPATVNEAPYILDGLLINRAGRRICEQYADSGGFTDHVFAVASQLGYGFIPRVQGLPSKRLHIFDPRRVPQPLIGLTGNKIREDVIVRNWPDILSVAGTLAIGALPPKPDAAKVRCLSAPARTGRHSP